MIDRVVVPVDFTAESARAIVIADVLANWAGAAVELVSVVEPFYRGGLEERLEGLARSVGDTATWRIVESGGSTEATLLTELHRGEKELWCVGSHARTALGELLIGSLSEDLVRDAHVPIVLIGPHATAPPTGRTMAVALDGTARSEGMLPTAADIAAALGMTLRLLQVAGRGSEDLPRDSVETAYVAHVAARVPSIDPRTADYDVLHGHDAGHELADYVDANPEIGMVALATRGLSGGARLRHGSTAFELAHAAPVPVLVLHQV